MAVIQRRSTATVTVCTTVVLAVILIIIIIIVIFLLYRKRHGPFRRSPSPAITLSTDQPTSRPASCFRPKFSKPPESPRSPRPWREAQNQPMRSEQHKTPHRNYGQPVPGTANSKTPAQGSTTRGTTRTTQPLPGTSSTVTMFKVPTSEPVRPLPPTPSKLPPVRKATPINNHGVPYPPQPTYISPSSTASAARTRTASNTPSPPPQQPKRTLTSTSPLRNPTSHKTLRSLFSSSSTTPPPISTFNPQTRPLRSPISERDILPPPQTHQNQDHPALRHPASSPSLPHTKPIDIIPPTLLQPLPFPLTSDTTDLSTDLANPNEQAHLGYKNATSTTPAHSQSQSQPQQSHLKLPSSTSSRPLVNSTYANFLNTRMQNSPSSLSPHPNSASLAALLVGSEAGTTDAGTTDAGGRTPDMNNNNNNKKGTEGGAGGGGGGVGGGRGGGSGANGGAGGRGGGLATLATAAPLTGPTTSTDDAIRNRQGGRWYGSSRGRGTARRERNKDVDMEVEERYKRFREKGDFAGEDKDDPVGRPWGRFDSSAMREREGEGGREGGDDGGSAVGPLRVGGKNMI